MAQRRVWREALQRALRKAISQPTLAIGGAGAAEGAVAAGEFRSAGRTLADLLHSAGQGPSGLRSKHLSSAAWLFTAGSAAAALSTSTVSAGSFFSVESSPVAESEAGSTSSDGVTTEKKLRVVFVLGGPGSGKGTQCTKIVDEFGFTHLSAGDLLRAEIKSGSEYGTMIQTMIKEGKIVPAEVTVNLLKKAMKDSGNDKFLIDGFPRNDENRECFERETGIEPEFILFFDCPEEVMEARLLGRNQGRIDDNIETIRKRFKVFVEQSIPVVEHYEKRGKVNKVDATKTPDEVFKTLSPFFVRFIQD